MRTSLALAALGGSLSGSVSAQLSSTPYAPQSAACPSTPLMRDAVGLSSDEAAFVKNRKHVAGAAYRSWLTSLGREFPTHLPSIPVIGAAWSGGGFRALLMHAGSRFAFDKRGGTPGVAGLYQTFTYESALSGGSWMLGGIAGDGYSDFIDMYNNYYLPNIQNGLLTPGGTVNGPGTDLSILVSQVTTKFEAGYPVNLIDFYGRLIGYNTLSGAQGGIAQRWSDVASAANYTSWNVPFPIITSIALNNSAGCGGVFSPLQAQMEITPVEFGSWDSSIAAFTPTKYLGTSLRNGVPTTPQCTVGYDNTGFIQGSSGNVFSALACVAASGSLVPAPLSDLMSKLNGLLAQVPGLPDAADTTGATYPNPFYQLTGVDPAYQTDSYISLVDGATTGQNNPVWPHLRRSVDLLIVGDDEADLSSLYAVYQAAQAEGITRMPVIPTDAEYDNKTIPRMFGCHNPNAMTIVWLPGYNWVSANDVTYTDLQLTAAQIESLVANGRAAANGNGTANWDKCLGCATMLKTGMVRPAICETCDSTYCWN